MQGGFLVAGHWIDRSELECTFSRSPGPGGQNVNKLNTKATVRWRVTATTAIPEPLRDRILAVLAKRITLDGDLLITSSRHREQRRNLDDCFAKLAQLLTAAVTPPKSRKATKPTRAAQARRVRLKREHSQKKQSRQHHPDRGE